MARIERTTHKTEIQASNRPELLTKSELAEYLKLTTRTVENWMARGLPHYKIGERRVRFKLAEVEQFLDTECRVVRVK
jgi:excisionase family DNA binding protein